MFKEIIILGSTGSIGKSTLRIIDKNKKDFKIKLEKYNNLDTEEYVYKDTFKEREGNDPIVNKIIEGMEVEVKEIDMSDVPSGKWEGDPPSDKQISILEEKIKDAIDSGNDDLAAKAKSFLNSGNATKKNIFDWINTEGDWSLKDGS